MKPSENPLIILVIGLAILSFIFDMAGPERVHKWYCNGGCICGREKI